MYVEVYVEDFALCEVICSIDFDSSVMFIMRLPVIVGACSFYSTGFHLLDIAVAALSFFKVL